MIKKKNKHKVKLFSFFFSLSYTNMAASCFEQIPFRDQHAKNINKVYLFSIFFFPSHTSDNIEKKNGKALFESESIVGHTALNIESM